MKRNSILYLMRSFQKELIRCFSEHKDELVRFNNDPCKCGITLTQIQIIEHIIESKGKDIYQRDLEDILNLRRATVSGVLQTMEKNGLVERVSYLEDSRVKKIILKSKAYDLFSYNKQKLDLLEQEVLKDISEDDLEIFSRILNKMKNNISTYSKDKR